MTRMKAISLSVLLIAILSASVTACGSETPQQKDGKTSDSASQKNEQTNGHANNAGEGGKLTYIGQPPKLVFGSSYVGPLTEIFGDVFIGQKVFIASNSILRAAPGNKVEVGDESNVQDNVTVRARNDSTMIGDRTSLTHHATVENSDIGNSVFVGYDAMIRNSRVGDRAFIYHGAQIEGVKIPEESFVGAGEIVSDQATADALPKTDDIDIGKYYDRKEHLDTNTEFAKAYIDLYEKEGYDAVVEVGPNPKTPWNPKEVEPQIGDNVELQEFARVTGDVHIGASSSIGYRTSIRADEGDPISIGSGAILDDRVTLHATRGSEVQIGKNLVAGDDSVLHGPLEMGDDDVVGVGAVVFRARLGDNVQIGEGAVIAGLTGKESTLEIPDDTFLPASAVVTSEKDVRALTG